MTTLSTTPTGTRPRIRSLTSSLRTLGGSALLAAATAQSNGDFIGFDYFVSVNEYGNTVYEVYSAYDREDIVLNIFDAEIPGDFIQNEDLAAW